MTLKDVLRKIYLDDLVTVVQDAFCGELRETAKAEFFLNDDAYKHFDSEVRAISTENDEIIIYI
ncbi:hypothetical protein NNG48_07250 [Enterococcus faecium]|nr:hypothetical protein [Enterococcus faecium]